MMSTFMIYALIVSMAITAAAIAVERTLRLWRREARFVWGGAMAISIAVPVLSVAQSLGWMPPLSDTADLPAMLVTPLGAVIPTVAGRNGGPRLLDAVATIVWLVASLGLATRFIIAWRSLARRRREWRAAVIDGQPLLVSPDAGPAVIGFRRPAIVVPEWVLELDASLRRLVLCHEREHVDKGDPRLLLGAVAAAVVAPWNPMLWYQLHRLRSSMELDCDLRVLRAHPETRRYGSLLLAVAQRADRGGLLAPALTESNSLLTQRIVAMRPSTPRHRITRSVAMASVAGLLTIVACELEAPADPAREPIAAAPKPTFVPAGAPMFEFQVESPATPLPGGQTPRYPEELRKAGIEGEVLTSFIVGPDGRVDVGSFKVMKSTHREFTDAVARALPDMRFKPATVGGKAVRQLIQQPFSFALQK